LIISFSSIKELDLSGNKVDIQALDAVEVPIPDRRAKLRKASRGVIPLEDGF